MKPYYTTIEITQMASGCKTLLELESICGRLKYLVALNESINLQYLRIAVNIRVKELLNADAK